MPDKPKYNPQIHHRRSIRLQGYDYSQPGFYFITICTKNRECLFGKIENHEMIWNDAGKIVNEYWLEIPKHFPHAVLHEHIVMPNHVHGIIELTETVANNIGSDVGAEYFLPLQSPQPKQTVWQRNYYEHIIRDEQSYHTISNYIRNNPSNWNNDMFFK